MAWSYSDYESQTSDSARLDRLRLHIAEVSAEIGPDLRLGNRARQNAAAVQYLDQLNRRRDQLERKVRAQTASFTRLRPV